MQLDSVWHLLRKWQSLGSRLGISGRYAKTAPSFQNALDVFKGEWWSQLPPPFSHLEAGKIRMYDDPRVRWALSQLAPVNGETVLELGPLEASHTYMLQRAGFGSILSIEANPRAYLKCLIVKEILELEKARFLCGDFLEYLRNTPSRVDVVFASGVLYHMMNPVELIARVSEITSRLFLWTHYFEPDLVSRNPGLRNKFEREQRAVYSGFEHRLFRFNYGRSSSLRSFCGGSRPYANWMRREEIIACLKHFGFAEIRLGCDEPNHPSGPAFAVAALR